MNYSTQKKNFWIGTFFLYLAMLVLTVVPLFVTQQMPFVYIKIKSYISFSLILFLAASVFYFMSKDTYKRQIISIACAFTYFYIFINFFAD